MKKKFMITFFLSLRIPKKSSNHRYIYVSAFFPCKAHRFKIMLKYQKPVEEYHLKISQWRCIIQCSKSISFWSGSGSWIRSVDLKSRKYQLLKNFFWTKLYFFKKWFVLLFMRYIFMSAKKLDHKIYFYLYPKW